MDCHYCWNQPKKFGQYDFYLDGKIKADEFVYRKKNEETGKIESFSITDEIDTINERLKTHFTFETTYKTYSDLETAFNNGELKETVIYVVENENSSDNPDSKDKYNEYMIISVTNDDGSVSKSLELIGSGSYTKQTADVFQVTGYAGFDSFDSTKKDGKDINSRINKEIADRIADVNSEETRATGIENDIKSKLTVITGYDYGEDLTTEGGNIDSRIKNEISRATTRENSIQEIYDSITGYNFEKVTDSSKSIKSIIEKEISDRIADVEDEEERATKAEDSLNTKLSNTESSINGKIDLITGYKLTESGTLKDGEKNIDSRIKEEITRATLKETELNTAISDEVSRASKAEENISARVKTIEDYNLDTRIITEKNRIDAIIGQNLDSRLKTVEGKFDGYATITMLAEEFKTLNETIAALEERIVTLENPVQPEPEPEPENPSEPEETPEGE